MMFLAALALATGVPAEATAPALAHCTSKDPYSRDALAAAGWRFASSYSLRAPGQRIQLFEKDGVASGVSIRSSAAIYVACSTSVDLPSAADFRPAVDNIALSLQATRIDRVEGADIGLFLKANELPDSGETYANETHQFLFELRQFSGRDLMIVYVFGRDKGSQ